MKTVGQILREKREKVGISQRKVASIIGVKCDTIRNWERGYSYPNILHCCDLADIYGCTLDELVGRERNPVCVSCGKQPSEEESLLCYECNRLTT